MSYYHHIILFLFGLIFGSFLNVVSLRFKPENNIFDLKKISGRSACPYCKKTLSWYELIPLLSFFIQNGKCRSCKRKLTLQYPLVEFLSGLIFAAAAMIPVFGRQFSFSDPIHIMFWLSMVLFFLVLLLISLIDFRLYLIPDGLTRLLFFFGLAFVAVKSLIPDPQLFNWSFLRNYALLFSFNSWVENIWPNHLFAVLTAGAFIGLLFVLGKGKMMGSGDIGLAAALGLFLGWPDIIMAFSLAFILGGAVGIISIISRKKTMKSFLPFAPFLAAGTALTIFFGYQIVNGYFYLFSL